jgi:competence protein ComFC
MRCLICHEPIQPKMDWRALFSPEQEQQICPTCEGKLEKITGGICRICGRPFAQLDPKFRHENICHDCLRWEEDPDWSGYLGQNRSLFVYNDFLKEVIAKYKYRGDYVLAKVFAQFFKPELSQIYADVYVPIPLSDERQYERGFNQAEAILTEARIPPTHLLTRTHTEKQSKKNREARIHLPQVFQLAPGATVAGKRIVLIDDIYTTGSTLRHAAKLLKTAGADSIQSLTIAR